MPFFRLATFVFLIACQTPARHETPELLRFFQPQSLPDTLHMETNTQNIQNGDTIPNRVFFKGIPDSLLQPIGHIADTAEATVLSRGYFPLTSNIAAYWVEIRLFWFQHHSLFLYNKSQSAFTDRITVAEWYGGDGGQVLMGSWLFDYDDNGTRDIVRIEMEHSLVPSDDAPIEQTTASATLLRWENGRFVHSPVQDTASLVRRFPIRSVW